MGDVEGDDAAANTGAPGLEADFLLGEYDDDDTDEEVSARERLARAHDLPDIEDDVEVQDVTVEGTSANNLTTAVGDMQADGIAEGEDDIDESSEEISDEDGLEDKTGNVACTQNDPLWERRQALLMRLA